MVTTKTKKLGNQGCFGLWNLPIMHCSMKLFLLSPLLWIICKTFMPVCDYMVDFLITLFKRAFLYLQISDQFSAYSQNYAVPQDWWLLMPRKNTFCLNRTINACFVWFCHHQQEANDNQFYRFLAFSATTMVLHKHTITTAKEKLK